MLEYKKIPNTFLKGKDRQLLFNEELNLYKRKRSLDGIEHLHHWKKFIDDYKDKKINCLEIGSHEGQSAIFFLKKLLLNKDSTLLCCDPWIKSHWLNIKGNESGLCYEDIFDFNIKNNDIDKKITKYYGTNDKLYIDDLFKNIEYFDIIYIDDIHTEKSTRLNIENCWKKLKVGGLMIFDDYNYKLANYDEEKAKFFCEPVKLVVDEFINNNNNIEVIHEEYQKIIKRII